LNKITRVERVLDGRSTDGPARGELFIWSEFVGKFSGGDGTDPNELHRLLDRLGADIVVAEAEGGTVDYWRKESDLFVLALISGPLWAIIENLGWEEFCRLAIRNPDSARAQAKLAMNRHIEQASRCLEAGAHGILILDDLAGDDGPLISPGAMRQTIIPVLSESVDELRRLGRPVVFHSDGNTTTLFKDLFRIGFSAYHFQPVKRMDMAGMRAAAEEGLALWGGLDLTDVSGWKSPEEIAAETAALIRDNASNRYIFGSTTGLYPEVPLEPVLAAYDAAAAVVGERHGREQ